MTKIDRANFGSKLGVILASAGSAVGLGNIWRFPYETGNHGGAAFILIYLGCVFLLGLPILIAEFLIGRRSRANTAGAYQKLAPGTHWRWVGRMGVLAAFLILSYYSVVAGWTLEYVYEALTNGFTGKTPTEFISSFQQFSSSPWRPVLWLVLFLLVTHFIIVKGVEKGIEKSSKIMMPTLFIIILILVICSVTLPGAGAGIEFLLKPDFSKFSTMTVLSAMGQLFYSMSLAMGIMITYGSYVKDDVDLNKTTNQIEIFDTGVAFLAGMMILPAVYVFLGKEGMASGPSLIFISLPKVFAAMRGAGRIVAIAFFLMMGFAALTSCVSVMETLVANCMEVFHRTRKKMCGLIGVYSLVTAVLICLGYNVLYFELPLPNGSTGQLLDVMDYISNSFLMPFISLLTSILIGWVIGPDWIVGEVEKNGERFTRAKLYRFMIKYVVPVVMLILFLTSTGLLNRIA